MWVRPVEIIQNQPGTAAIVLSREASTVSAVLENISGANSNSLTTSLQSEATTIGTPSSVSPNLTSVVTPAGIVSGEALLHIPATGPSTALYVAEISGVVVTFESPPAQPFTSGDEIKSLDVLATIPSGLTATLGTDYRVVWTVTYADGGIEAYDQPVYICKTKFRESPSLGDAARYISIRFPSSAATFQGERLRYAVHRAQDMVRAGILETGRFAHLTGNSGAYMEAGLIALKAALIDEGLYDRNVNLVEYTEQLRKALHGAISQANKQLNYDADSSGTVEPSEFQQLGAIPIRRH